MPYSDLGSGSLNCPAFQSAVMACTVHNARVRHVDKGCVVMRGTTVSLGDTRLQNSLHSSQNNSSNHGKWMYCSTMGKRIWLPLDIYSFYQCVYLLSYIIQAHVIKTEPVIIAT